MHEYKLQFTAHGRYIIHLVITVHNHHRTDKRHNIGIMRYLQKKKKRMQDQNRYNISFQTTET